MSLLFGCKNNYSKLTEIELNRYDDCTGDDLEFLGHCFPNIKILSLGHLDVDDNDLFHLFDKLQYLEELKLTFMSSIEVSDSL
ncbi:hypothetical protein B4U80_14946 [Leptotrombidium deliense]|uniref:Uncharacterized protein n=1 Tax=Leptotrombidium deliense TaxID=299467 RepID=A0A443RXT6_9ACAR|nr:hypothetical protein B4U80_14946 [Leptotrombidium deliense]